MAFAGFLAFARAWITPAIIPTLPAPLLTENAARVPESEVRALENDLVLIEEIAEEEEEKEADVPEEELGVLEMEVDVPEREAICAPHQTEKAACVPEQEVDILDIGKGTDVRVEKVLDAARKAMDCFDRAIAGLGDSTEEEGDVLDREALFTPRPTEDAARSPGKEVDLLETEKEVTVPEQTMDISEEEVDVSGNFDVPEEGMDVLLEVVDVKEEEVDVKEREVVCAARMSENEADVPDLEAEPFRLLDLPMDVFALVIDEYMSDVTFDEMWAARETCCTLLFSLRFSVTVLFESLTDIQIATFKNVLTPKVTNLQADKLVHPEYTAHLTELRQ
jgi:hypothetical protein